MKMLIPKIPVPVLGSEEYSSIPNNSNGKPIRISIIAKKIANALGSAIKYN
jgi:hypothetical protein